MSVSPPALQPQPERLVTREKPRGQLANTQVGSYVMRGLLVLCGLGLIAGFFMRWFTLGEVMSVSGFSLLVTEGQVVTMLSGSNRFLLFAVPIFGIVLLIGGVIGHRMALWAGLVAGISVLGFGSFTLVRFFLETTGLGMWIVVASSLLALGLALIGIGRSER